ncbi:hypothetical protein M9H77_25033 [Catharanthus roseus]|uniref:Uncharacterized protein n=1 Tax=Catharanthus roseus TaxID=4058 RepID=A0ACC0A7L7_CATRO|nr:hypothetical protein M9H77_25033 [Catharanthus roseus]
MAFLKFMIHLFLLSLLSVAAVVERSAYIVHMDKSMMPRVLKEPKFWYQNIMESVLELENSQLLYTYHHAIHGFCALLSKEEVQILAKRQDVLSVIIDRKGKLDTTHTSKFLSLNADSGLLPKSNFGRDVIIGVIDSGVWPEHPSFQDHGLTKVPSRWKGKCEGGHNFNSTLCNRKLIGVRYFNKGSLAENSKKEITNTARDIKGHGTHTASTAAGNYVKDASFFGYAKGTARGIAPHARLSIYNVQPLGEPFSSDVLAGIDQAVADGVDIISVSLGFDSQNLFEDQIAIASFGAMEKGILVSCSAGNIDTFGELHNGSPWVLTVAASSIDRQFSGTLALGNGINIIGWSIFPARAIVKDLPLLYNSTISACSSRELMSQISGKIVICEESNDYSSFLNQIEIVKQSGLPAGIFISTAKEIFEFPAFSYPGVVISPNQASNVIKYALTDSQPTATMYFQQTFLGEKVAPGAAAYSARGPSPSNPGILKPDVMAPGTLVLAAWIPDKKVSEIGYIGLSSDFNLDSGTSMACPHATGIAALLKGAHLDWSPAAIRSAMITTANPFDNTKNPIKDLGLNYEIASPLAMGAGQVDPNRAMDPGLVYDATAQDYINFLCSMNFTHAQISTITRTASYKCSNPSSDLNYPSFIVLYNNETKNIMVQKFQRTVTNMGDGAVAYEARVTEPKGSNITVYPETLIFGSKNDKQNYSLTISYIANPNRIVTFGSLVWVEKSGNHTVRSPIVVAPMKYNTETNI